MSARVAAEQRRRILTAVPLALACGKGYESVAVERIVALSGVSRRTFYELFEDRADVFLAAYDEAFGYLHRATMTAAVACERWPERIVAALRSALDLAAAHPLLGSMIAVEPLGASPALRRHHYRCLDRFVPLLRDGRQEQMGSDELPETLEPALVGAVCQMVGSRLHRGVAGSLPMLVPDLADLLLTPYGWR